MTGWILAGTVPAARRGRRARPSSAGVRVVGRRAHRRARARRSNDRSRFWPVSKFRIGMAARFANRDAHARPARAPIGKRAHISVGPSPHFGSSDDSTGSSRPPPGVWVQDVSSMHFFVSTCIISTRMHVYGPCCEPHRSPRTGFSKPFAAQYICQNLDSCTEMCGKRTPDGFPCDLHRMPIESPSSGETKLDLMFSENLRGVTCVAHRTSQCGTPPPPPLSRPRSRAPAAATTPRCVFG
jgi:hypothetical protein